MSQAQGPAAGILPPAPSLPGTLRPGLPALLYGVRLWAAVCLALYVAFRLELQNPSWAGTTAAIVCQPAVGASLRKGWFRLIGTVIGAVMAVLLTAAFPQSRAGFLLSLTLWCAVCAMASTLLRNFASYAAALSGYTAAIIAADELGLVGGANGQAFTLAVTRASEICLGIVCAGIVLAGTDLGRARQQLVTVLARLSGQIAAGLANALALPSDAQAPTRTIRRRLYRSVAGLGTLMDQAAGEISAIPFRPRAFRAVTDGLFRVLSAWRAIATHLEREPTAVADAARVRDCLPALDAAAPGQDLAALHEEVLRAARRLILLPAATPSARLLADRAAEGLLGLGRALSGMGFLAGLRRSAPRARTAMLRVPDPLVPLLNGVRAFLTIGAATLIWIVTGWPGGTTMMLFASITVILFSPRDDAYAGAVGFLTGTVITTALAAIVGFALLPSRAGYPGFCAAIGLVLIPAGALSAQAWRQPLFIALATNFIPLLAPDNPESYDPATFYNTGLALLAGVGLAMMAFRLLPPLAAKFRAGRLLLLTLRDLRRLAVGRLPRSVARWESRIYGRLAAMPDEIDTLQHARVSAALTMGSEIIRLRRMAGRFRLEDALRPALAAIAAGRSADAIADLAQFDAALAAIPPALPGARLRSRSRGTIRAIIEALETHASYFSAPTGPRGTRR